MATAPAARCSALTLVCAGALAAAGCFSDRGVAIEVATGGTAATTVELFIGQTACSAKDNAAGIACTTIAPPPDGSVPLDGAIWFRDAPAPYTAEVSGGTATFQIRAATATTLPIVIAVGFVRDDQAPQGRRAVATATLRDVAIPIDSARVITTALTAANPLQLAPGDTRNLTEDRVLVWPKQTPESACLVVEHWDHGQHHRDFVVPEGDPDCDDVPPGECNPAAYLGSNAVGGLRNRPECFTSSGGPACVLGAFGCQDNVAGNDHTCFPLAARTCVPDAFCGCQADDDPCWRTLLSPVANPVARIECRVPTRLAALGKLDLCPNKSQATIDLDAFFATSKCPQPEIGGLPGLGFDKGHVFDGVTMELSGLVSGKPCEFTVAWTGGTRPAASPADDFGILQFKSDDATEATLLLPIVFRFLSAPTDTCATAEFTCDYAPMAAGIDSLWSCVP